MTEVPALNRPSNLDDALAWRAAAELARRFGMQVIEWHPGGGQYDELGLLRPPPEEGVAITIRRPEARVLAWGRPYPLDGTHSLRDTLDVVCAEAGLHSPETLPSTTRPVLTVRLIAALAAAVSFEETRWDVRSGYEDTSGYGGGTRSAWFAQIPGASARRSHLEPGDLFGEAGYRFWFVRRGEDLLGAFETTGYWHPRTGASIDAMALYRKHRRLHAVLARLPGLELP